AGRGTHDDAREPFLARAAPLDENAIARDLELEPEGLGERRGVGELGVDLGDERARGELGLRPGPRAQGRSRGGGEQLGMLESGEPVEARGSDRQGVLGAHHREYVAVSVARASVWNSALKATTVAEALASSGKEPTSSACTANT